MWNERSICWGSPLEAKLFADQYDGCGPGTYSDHTLWIECGYLGLRERQEAVLRAHLPYLAEYLAVDAQQQLFDHFVTKRSKGAHGAKDYARVLIDSTAEAPLPEFEPKLFEALARAAANVLAVYAPENGPSQIVLTNTGPKSAPGSRYIKLRGVGAQRAMGWRKCPLTQHQVPSETPEMKAALANMKAAFSDVWGAPSGTIQQDNLPASSRFSPYWVVLEDLLEPNYMGSGWQESWGEQGSDSVHVPFPRIQRLYYVDEKNRIRAKKPLHDYLDKWAPGWRGAVSFQVSKAVDAGRLSSLTPSAIRAAKEAEKKAKEAAAMKAKDGSKPGRPLTQRAALAVGGSLLVAGAVALWYSSRKQSNG